jgi:uncharacterized membrane protein YedE/YeeE
MIEIIVGLIVGGLWGYILYKSMVCDHGCIVGGLALKNMNMLLVIMTSVVTTGLIIYPLSALEIVKLIPKPTYVIGNVAGGALIGLGMAVAGYCPGTAAASVGAGKKDAVFAIIGGLVGAIIYPIIFPVIKPLLIDPLNLGKITVPGILASKLGIPTVISAYLILAVFIGAIIFMARLQKRYVSTSVDKVNEENIDINM